MFQEQGWKHLVKASSSWSRKFCINEINKMLFLWNGDKVMKVVGDGIVYIKLQCHSFSMYFCHSSVKCIIIYNLFA